MSRMTRVALLVAVAAAAGWLYRDRSPVAGTAQSAPDGVRTVAVEPDVLYTWVDAGGVTHYEQQAGNGRAVSYDGGRITPLEKPDPGGLERLRQAAGDDVSAADAPPGGGGTLPDLRRELEDGARKMQATRAARDPS